MCVCLIPAMSLISIANRLGSLSFIHARHLSYLGWNRQYPGGIVHACVFVFGWMGMGVNVAYHRNRV